MIALKRPLGLFTLFCVLATLMILSLMLGAMVWSRVTLLQNGHEIVLKTAPVDPRDLLRGYFTRLRYDISRISIEELTDPMSKDELGDGFERHTTLYVRLRPDDDGFWSPVSIHRTPPDIRDVEGERPETSSQSETPRSVYLRGRVLYRTCQKRFRGTHNCKVSLHYGIEKFFTQKKRARKLEDLGRQTTPEIRELTRQINVLQKQYTGMVRQTRNARSSESGKLKKLLSQKRKELSVLVRKNREAMAKRFAVIVRVDKSSGEAAISGLQLDGKQTYEERLF